MNKLDKQKVVIIGGTSGIGLATAVMAKEAGASVFAAGRSEEKISQAQAEHPGISFSRVDTHDVAGLQSLFSSVGSIDHIVAAATGANRTIAPFLEQTDEQFREAFNKFWGYTQVARHGIPCLKDTGSLTLVSGFPARKCNPGMSAVSCTGNAVEGFVRAIALEAAPKRINGVAPGTIATAMFGYQGKGELPPQLQAMGKNILMGRVGLADEVAQAIMLVMSNPYMTGTVIDVDGGVLLP